MSFQAQLDGVINAYVRQVRADFKHAISSWHSNASMHEVQSVYGGLLSRQCMLGTMLARRIDYWDNLIAPLILRAMVEVAINMSWTSIDPVARCSKFVSFGLGQSKLALEHARNLESIFQESKESVDAQALWLSAQRHEIFTDVNVGQWAEIDLETMAREAGVHELYTLYSCLSPASHGSWEHVFQFFLDSTDASAQPRIPDPCLNPNVIYLTGQLVDFSFQFFRGVANQNHDSTTFIQLKTELKKLRRAGG